MAQTPGGALGVQLGQLIFGNPAHTAQVEQAARSAAYLDNQRMQSAAKDRAAAMIGFDQYDKRQQYDPTALIDPSASLEQRAEAIRIGALANLGSNLNSGLDAYSKGRSQQRLDAADEAFRLGDIARANQSLAVAGGKPLETTSINNGQVYDKYAAPDQPVALTALGQAIAGEKNAHAGLYEQQRAAGGFSSHARSSQAAAANGTDAEFLSKDAQDLVSAALSHGYSIPLPNFGFSQRGAKAKADALNELAQRFKTQGVGMDDAVSSMINGKTATTGLTDIQRSSAKVNAWENSAARQADITLELSKKADRTGVPLVNKWLLAGKQATGDVDVAQFNNSVATLAEEYARVMGGGNATATDSTRQLAHTMLNSAMTPDQFEGVVQLMKREMATRKGALGESVNQQRAAIVAPAAPLAPDVAMEPPEADVPVPAIQPGHSEGGYTYIGGDPADPASWRKQ